MFFRGPFFRRAPRGAGLLQVELGSLETSEEVAAPTSSPAHLGKARTLAALSSMARFSSWHF